MNIPKGRYKHFKGHIYEVIGKGKHSETLEELVIYVSISDKNDIWMRPIDMFLDTVVLDGERLPRFEFIKNNEHDLE